MRFLLFYFPVSRTFRLFISNHDHGQDIKVSKNSVVRDMIEAIKTKPADIIITHTLVFNRTKLYMEINTQRNILKKQLLNINNHR